MKGLNNEFIANPVAFLRKYCVDNATWERGVQGVRTSQALSATKQGYFDFAGVSSTKVTFRHLAKASDVVKDTAIQAYYCPFVSGAESVGYVDMPASGGAIKFMFTPAMHGCQLDCTTPAPGILRVWHNQHPESQAVNALVTGVRVSSLTYADYAGDYDEMSREGRVKNALNCMYQIAGKWHFLSQATYLNADLSVTRNNDRAILLRGV